jgi:hypothetical protein
MSEVGTPFGRYKYKAAGYLGPEFRHVYTIPNQGALQGAYQLD